MRIQVTSEDVSLFHLAAHHYNDAMQWWQIADRNALTDPDLTIFDTPVWVEMPQEVALSSEEGIPSP